MKIAYADPPYPGKARKYYRDHPDFAGEVDHAELIAYLEREFPDGWALSTSADALQTVLPLCPPAVRRREGGGVLQQVRVMPWCKPAAQNGSGGGALHGWEPVIVRGGRRTFGPGRPRDWLVASPERPRPRPVTHVTGAKPTEFCRWLFGVLGLRPDDELVDIFAGSGGVQREWEAWSAQASLLEVPA